MTTQELTRSAARPMPAPRRYDPFDILQQEVDRVFDRFNGFRMWPPLMTQSRPASTEYGFSPSMEVTETDSAIEISTELPGMEEKDIDITLGEGLLTIRGEKKFEKDEKKKHYRLIERSYGAFERTVAVPHGVDAAAVKASMTKGVLKVEVPKPAAAKARQVKIATS